MRKNIDEKTQMYLNVVDYASFYVRQDRKLTKSVSKADKGNILISAINFIALVDNCFLFADNDDLRKGTGYFCDTVDTDLLFSNIFDGASNYLFNSEMVSNDDNFNNCILVLVDFINYMANLFDYDRVFTAQDLLDRQHEIDMENLKDFLKETEYYFLELANKRRVMMNEDNKYAVAYAAYKLELKGRGKNNNLQKLIRKMRGK